MIEAILSFVPTNYRPLAKRSGGDSTCRRRRHQFYVSVRRYRRSVSYPVAVLIYRCINYSYRVDPGLACIPARCSCSCNASAVGRFETADIAETPLRRCGPPFKRHVPFACRLQLRGPFTAADFLYLPSERIKITMLLTLNIVHAIIRVVFG